MAKYVEAPEVYPQGGDAVTVFLAGGITGCPDWQMEVALRLSETDLVLFNPRRTDFPMDDPTAAAGQIQWEHRHLKRADRILFWFPKDNAAGCPITLFELGFWLHSDKPIVVGIEPGYVREEDVRIQVGLERPLVPIVYTLEDLVEAIR